MDKSLDGRKATKGGAVMLKKYREWLYGIGVAVILVSGYLLFAGYGGSSPANGPSMTPPLLHRLVIWGIIVLVTITAMTLIGLTTRQKK